ncbi:MAG: membrane protein insertase YidC [Acidobacteriota bacterium]|jgi:YidC/Oxa1 family membrane protein insertase|nr:membrane protein insertase YidC [Acidobacteriota bacterium]
MEKRLILFLALSFLVIFGPQYFMSKKSQSQPVPATVAETPTAAAQTNPGDTAAAAPVPAPVAANESAAPASAAESTPLETLLLEDTQAAAQKIVIDGDLYTAVLDNRGGVLTSWELKGYQTTKKGKGDPGRVFDMIPSVSMGERLYPGALVINDDRSDIIANGEYYQVSVEDAEGQVQGLLPEKLVPPVVVKLMLRRGDLQIEKTWSFEKDNYTANLGIIGTKAGRSLDGRFFLGEDIGPTAEHFTSNAASLASVYSSGGKVKRESPPKDPQELKRIDGDVRWAGLDMQYFSMIAIPKQPLGYFNIQTVKLQETGIDGEVVEHDRLKVTLPLDSSGGANYQLYLGPKRQENLEQVGATDLSGVIDYGMFSFLVYPFLFVLRWIYQFAHNYGLAIILLTFTLSLILFPLRFKSMLSMKKMSKVQPKVKAIQDKYRQYKASDPRKREMNSEVMALYKEHGVNPMGGCLPMLLQMPILIAFYQLLAHTIDLRQAPFIWWVHDLSAKDPYYILPIAMGVTMFLSQKMAPMAPSTDPMQAKMMMIMPLVFLFIFLNTPSGLNLYFLCSNVFAIVFQKISERWIPKEAPVPAKGRAKG